MVSGVDMVKIDVSEKEFAIIWSLYDKLVYDMKFDVNSEEMKVLNNLAVKIQKERNKDK